MSIRTLLLLTAALSGMAGCASAPRQADRPTAQTLASGGVMPIEQARVHFDHAQLHFTVKPATQSIDAHATLRFTAKAPLDVLLLDLDQRLPISWPARVCRAPPGAIPTGACRSTCRIQWPVASRSV